MSASSVAATTSDSGESSQGTSQSESSQLDTTAGQDTDAALKLDVGGVNETGSGECAGRSTDATLVGQVLGPDGVIPVGDALVYLSDVAPEGIPQHVYCAECEELSCDVDSVRTDADGTFQLRAISGQGKYLVVQKGQFMRVVQVDIAAGTTDLAAELTRLPAVNDPANGLYIPRIAVADGAHDRLEDALGKFGLGDTSIMDYEERLVPGTEAFDLYENGREPAADGFVSAGDFGEFIAHPEQMAQYHIIFVPCTEDVWVFALSDPQNVQNIRDWVAAGGRWYVADWSNEWLQLVFPEYQMMYNWDGSAGSADRGSYDSIGTVLDDGLLAWLHALPEALKDINPLNNETHPTLNMLPRVQTLDNYSALSEVFPVYVQDDLGQQVDVGHKVWIEGPGGGGPDPHPLTVTGQYGCGKLQFTSYHAAEFRNYTGLSPQELVLIYTILEIGVCQPPLPPPAG